MMAFRSSLGDVKERCSEENKRKGMTKHSPCRKTPALGRGHCGTSLPGKRKSAGAFEATRRS